MVNRPIQLRDRIFIKGSRRFYFAKNMGINIFKNQGKNLSGKNCQKRLDHTKRNDTDLLKTASKKAIKKAAKATGDLIGSKVADL